MVCFVSGEEGKEGDVINCNIEMCAFFETPIESFQNRSTNIKKFLPAFVRDIHPQCMSNFRTTGQQSRIGHSSDAFVVKKGSPYKVEIKIMLFSAAVEIIYVARLKVIERFHQHILFDQQGRVQ